MATSNNLSAWQAEAKKQATLESDNYKKSQQYLIDQINKNRENSLKQIQQQEDNSIYKLNSNLSDINKTAENDAKQANINRLLALKSNEDAMSRAGLNSQGIVGSQNASINNSYGNNLTTILNQKNTNLRNLEKEKNDTILEYNSNRLKLENEYGSNLSNIQSQIDEKALNQYNNTYNNYLARLQQQYQNEQEEKQRAEEKRRWQLEYNLARKSSRSGGSGRSGGSSSKSDYNFDNSNNTNNTSLTGSVKDFGWTSNPVSTAPFVTSSSSKKYGVFKGTKQPKGITNYGKLTKSGYTTLVNGKEQNIWLTTTKGKTKAWIWDNKNKVYVGLA